MKLLHVNQQSHYSNKVALALTDIERMALTLGNTHSQNNGFVCSCPVSSHGKGRGDINPSLSIAPGTDGQLLLHCYAECDYYDIYQEIKARGLLANYLKTSAYQHTRTSKDYAQKIKPADSECKKTYAQQLWANAANPQGSAVETYLKFRGIHRGIPPTIRYIADAKHSPTGKTYPCMISAIMRWPDSQVMGVHRTFLSTDGKGKAFIEPNKMMLGDVSGGAVRLTLNPLGEILIVGEGIESMLSLVGVYTDYGIWAVLSASNFQSLVLPELPLASTIIIAADHDDAGLKAAKSAAKKWSLQGRVVKISCPSERGADFNDALLMGA